MAAATATTATIAVPRLAASSSPILRQPTSLLFPHKKPLTFTTSSSSPHSRLHQPLKYSTVPKISAVISVGDKLPEATLSCIEPSGDVRTVPISDLTAGRRIIIVAVPGAFTPTCSQNHLPGFVEKAAEFKAKGIDAIVCISVNDAFVMKAWKADLKIRNEVLLLSDGNGDFTRAIGCELDLRDNPVGLGVRSRRYAMYVKNGVVKILNLEEGGAVRVSSAEQMLEAI